MEIVSGNALDLRIAVYHFTKPNSPHQFITFPMVHVGSSEFYQKIAQKLIPCDIVLYEGIKSKKGSLGIRSYELVAQHLGLSLQKEALETSRLKHIEFIHADLRKQEFEGYWRQIPLQQRMLFNIWTFAQHIYAMASINKEKIANNMRINLRGESAVLFGENSKIDELFLKKRDQRLMHHMERQIELHKNTPKTFGILFGARHIQTIMRYLIDEQAYVVKQAGWVVVFPL